jgi:ribosomal protein S18 acetylase RimI-like enzyme
MTTVIRGANAKDERGVVALWGLCGLTASYNDPNSDFRFAFGKPSSDVLVAVNDAGKIIGSIMVGHDGHRGWLYYVSVDPSYRNQGIGRSLVEASEQWLTERDVAKVHLMVRETNAQVVPFYQRIGYDLMPRINKQKWLKKTL